MKSFAAELYNSIVRTNAYLIGLLGTLAQFASYYFDVDTTVALKWLTLPIFLVVIVVVVLVDLSVRALKAAVTTLPKVKSARSFRSGGQQGILLFVEPTNLLSIPMIVSIYHLNTDGWEILIGIGRVLHIQDNGVQIFITNPDLDAEPVWRSVANCDAATLRGLRVKPSAPYDTLQGLN